jgi:hypothetical protein
MTKNVFVVGLDEFNRSKLDAVRDRDHYEYHELLPLNAVQGVDEFPVREWLADAEARLDGFPRSIDAVIGFWDFPVSLMVPILQDEYGTPGCPLEAVVRCEHKYWSRLNQKAVAPDAVPRFQALDPFDDRIADRVELDYPFWLKPVKAFASQLGFRVDDEEELGRAVEKIRQGIGRFAEPFDDILDHVELPEEVAHVRGNWCVAEQILSGSQHTVEGYVHDGKVQVHGMIDSLNYPGTHSFFRYQYPSRLPSDVQDRATDLVRRVLDQVGFRKSPFNVELFYDEEDDHLWVLETNTRISQSHSDLFHKVDGFSNHDVLVHLATGEEPKPMQREGEYDCAAKCQLRVFEDGEITRVPDEDDLSRVREELPGTIVVVQCREGQRLSELRDQDSYSYRMGVVYLGADDEDELLERWDRCREIMGFEVDGERV